jgi:hypothetical protein
MGPRLNEPIEPMTLGNMCANGVRSLDLSLSSRCRPALGEFLSGYDATLPAAGTRGG